jgi:hypothetical protein
VIAYALAYTMVTYLRLPRLVYLPHARAFTFHAEPAGPLEMGYVGMWLWALLAGLAAGGIAWALLGRRRAEASPRALGLGVAWSMTAILIAGAFYTWHNWP